MTAPNKNTILIRYRLSSFTLFLFVLFLTFIGCTVTRTVEKTVEKTNCELMKDGKAFLPVAGEFLQGSFEDLVFFHLEY